MNIVYASSEDYFLPTYISIVSLIENSTSETINIFLIDYGIDSKNISKIESYCRKYDKTNFQSLNADHIIKRLEKGFNLKKLRGSYGTYTRLFLNKLFPEHDRLILIDSDSLILNDLSDLWNQDIEHNVIGAVEDYVVQLPYSDHESHDLLNRCVKYYNMGIILVDLIQWRSNKCDELIESVIHSNKLGFKIADQSIMNSALSGLIHQLDCKWNYQTYLHYNVSRLYRKLFERMNYESAPRGLKDPCIIHFIGHWFERPWYKWNTAKYKSEYHRHMSMVTNSKIDIPKDRGFFRLSIDFIIFFQQVLLACTISYCVRYYLFQRIKKITKNIYLI